VIGVPIIAGDLHEFGPWHWSVEKLRDRHQLILIGWPESIDAMNLAVIGDPDYEKPTYVRVAICKPTARGGYLRKPEPPQILARVLWRMSLTLKPLTFDLRMREKPPVLDLEYVKRAFAHGCNRARLFPGLFGEQHAD
jgi:hypothetical protein